MGHTQGGWGWGVQNRPFGTVLQTDLTIACEIICFSSIFAARDVLHGGTSATQRQKFHTDDVKSVQKS